jgi:hypothetical protein
LGYRFVGGDQADFRTPVRGPALRGVVALDVTAVAVAPDVDVIRVEAEVDQMVFHEFRTPEREPIVESGRPDIVGVAIDRELTVRESGQEVLERLPVGMGQLRSAETKVQGEQGIGAWRIYFGDPDGAILVARCIASIQCVHV